MAIRSRYARVYDRKKRGRWADYHDRGEQFVPYPDHKPTPRTDMTGKTDRHLTVVGPLKYDINAARWIWLCKCDCGNTCETSSWAGTRLSAASCGCQRGITSKERKKELAKQRAKEKLIAADFERFVPEKKRSCAEGSGNDEWRALSGKIRSHRLARIPELGSFEKERLTRQKSKATIERRNKARSRDPYAVLAFGSFGSVTICE